MLRGLHRASIFLIGCIIFYYGIIFTGHLPDHPLISGYNDLLLHIAAFSLLTFIALPVTQRRNVVIAALFVFAAAVELVQLALPDRTASLQDLLASFTGVVLAWAPVVTISKLCSSLLHSKLFPKRRVNV